MLSDNENVDIKLVNRDLNNVEREVENVIYGCIEPNDENINKTQSERERCSQETKLDLSMVALP